MKNKYINLRNIEAPVFRGSLSDLMIDAPDIKIPHAVCNANGRDPLRLFINTSCSIVR
ncbi:MAG: hypothetical protein BroJett015_12790 [Chloroflexota bacterium]|nr:MAG: hypothetical protein BroJett015_12790 [Chloroflexota bacterium]